MAETKQKLLKTGKLGRKIGKIWRKRGMPAGIRRDGHLLFEVEMYLQKGCIMVSGVGSS